MTGLLNASGHQQLHEMADVQRRRCRVETDIGRDRACVQVGRQCVHIGRLGDEATPSQFFKQRVHPDRLAVLTGHVG